MASSTKGAAVVLFFLSLQCTSHRGPRSSPAPAPLAQPTTGAGRAPTPPATGRLPPDVRPSHYDLRLEIDPQGERFSGSVNIAIELGAPRDTLWIHGKGITARAASLRLEGGAVVPAAYAEASDGERSSGFAAVRLGQPVGPGRATLHIDFEASFGQFEGLYRISRDARSYAFTQFEPVGARQAFPCFDEPGFKAPFDVTVVVPKGQQVISNAREVERVAEPGGMERFVFATTPKLPTYLVALAVGPLDVVLGTPIPPSAARSRPLPLRGAAVRGRGAELAYALERAGPLVAALEEYFGAPYPFDKLDLIAVPDKGSAMENAGAITFDEWSLLLGEKSASTAQRRELAGSMAHELAHQWFGDLVTMEWWDDLWLKEAFATWMGYRTAAAVTNDALLDLDLLEEVGWAMDLDRLVSARPIRERVRDTHAIYNAFDSLTYFKGSAILTMFERWIGPDALRRGIGGYLEAHRFGTATASDFLSALSSAARRDVAAPFDSFLTQAGVPHLEIAVQCSPTPVLSMRQSRYLPLGSTGDPSHVWQVPVCVRYPSVTRGATTGQKSAPVETIEESCVLLTDAVGTLPLKGATCPRWVMPNAGGAGYYLFSLPSPDLQALIDVGYNALSARERMSLASSANAAFSRGSTPAAEILRSLVPFARDEHRAVAVAPLNLLLVIMRWFEGDPLLPSIEAFGRELYASRLRSFGWGPRVQGEAERPDRAALRRAVIEFLALSARDPEVRKEALRHGRAYLGAGRDGALHPEAVDSDLVDVALAVTVEEGDGKMFETLLAHLRAADDTVTRRRLAGALGRASDPKLAAQARDCMLDGTLRPDELLEPLQWQLRRAGTREAAWSWLEENADALIARLPPPAAGRLPWLAASFCDKAHALAAQRLFERRAQHLDGGPRNLAIALEHIALCDAQRQTQKESARSFFMKRKRSP